MSNLFTIAIALFATVQLSTADLIGDLVGKWTSKDVPARVKYTKVFKRLGNKSFTSSSSFAIPGGDASVIVMTYKADGTVSGRFETNDDSGPITGTWRISGNTLSEKIVAKGVDGTSNTMSTHKVINPRKVKVVIVGDDQRTTRVLKKLR